MDWFPALVVVWVLMTLLLLLVVPGLLKHRADLAPPRPRESPRESRRP